MVQDFAKPGKKVQSFSKNIDIVWRSHQSIIQAIVRISADQMDLIGMTESRW
jgi:hypothetical protein